MAAERGSHVVPSKAGVPGAYVAWFPWTSLGRSAYLQKTAARRVVTMSPFRSRSTRISSAWACVAFCLVLAVSGCTSATEPTSRAAASQDPRPTRDMSWSEAVELGAGMFPVLAVGPNSTTVVWNSEADINGPLHVRSRESGKPWLPAQQIGFGAEHAVASNSSDVTVAAWAQASRHGSRVMVTRRESGGRWSAPQELSRLPSKRTVPGFGLHVAERHARPPCGGRR